MASEQTPVWFITGGSSGFGEALSREALSRGHKVIATSRNLDALKSLKQLGADVLQLDVTASLADLKAKAEEAYKLHGQLDFLVNNAGLVYQGTLEEVSPQETQEQFDINVFGLLNVTRAFLPYLRAQRSGIIANVSAVGCWGGWPGAGVYTASKWAVTGFSETMSGELAEFGIKAVSVEPGFFRSNLLNADRRKVVESSIDDYEGTAARKFAEVVDSVNGKQPGDLARAARVTVDALTGKHGDVPVRLPLGQDAYDIIKKKCNDTLALLEKWKDIVTHTDYDDVATS